MKYLTRTIWLLALVSMFNDMSSEMLYPVLPAFLQSIGFTVVWIGFLEGLAEGLAGISKMYFGRLSDTLNKRMLFVQSGYALSAIAKSMLGLLQATPAVFAARSMDRLGKGVRASARDALLAKECAEENRGRVFGFHKAFDTLGAAIGPLLALLYLWYNPGDYKKLFLLAFIPAAVAVLFTFFVKDRHTDEKKEKHFPDWKSTFSYWREADINYKRLLPRLLLFVLINSSDLFLLMQAKAVGLTDVQVIAVYIFYNLIFALAAFPLGHLADRIGMKATFMIGISLFACCYLGMAFADQLWQIILCFFFYGLYNASTDGVSKAWISTISPKNKVATAMGYYTGLTSLLTLVASLLAGWIWQLFEPGYVFIFSGLSAVLLCLLFATYREKRIESDKR